MQLTTKTSKFSRGSAARPRACAAGVEIAYDTWLHACPSSDMISAHVPCIVRCRVVMTASALFLQPVNYGNVTPLQMLFLGGVGGIVVLAVRKTNKKSCVF